MTTTITYDIIDDALARRTSVRTFGKPGAVGYIQETTISIIDIYQAKREAAERVENNARAKIEAAAKELPLQAEKDKFAHVPDLKQPGV